MENEIFCNNTFLDNIILTNSDVQSLCKEHCRTPCNEYSYDLNILKIEYRYLDYTLPTYYIANQDYYTKIKYSPSLEFVDLIINLTNIWSLWHGMSFIKIVIEFFALIKRISSKFRIPFSIHLINIMKLFQHSNFDQSLKVIFLYNF